MFQRLTKKAIKALGLAQSEVHFLGHYQVNPEQILVGLLNEGTSVAAQTLSAMGFNREVARGELEKVIGHGSGVRFPDVPMAPHAKKVLEVSSVVADEFGDECIGTEHILLGIIRGGGGVSLDILRNRGVNLAELQELLLQKRDEWDVTPQTT